MIALFISVLLFIPSVIAVFFYTRPMEDVAYRLFSFPEDGQEWEGVTGWTVFTMRTE